MSGERFTQLLTAKQATHRCNQKGWMKPRPLVRNDFREYISHYQPWRARGREARFPELQREGQNMMFVSDPDILHRALPEGFML